MCDKRPAFADGLQRLGRLLRETSPIPVSHSVRCEGLLVFETWCVSGGTGWCSLGGAGTAPDWPAPGSSAAPPEIAACIHGNAVCAMHVGYAARHAVRRTFSTRRPAFGGGWVSWPASSQTMVGQLQWLAETMCDRPVRPVPRECLVMRQATPAGGWLHGRAYTTRACLTTAGRFAGL